MNIEFTGKRPAPSRGRKLGVWVLIGSGALAVIGIAVAAILVVPSAVQTFSAAPSSAPGSTSQSLSSGRWVVFERTGTQSDNGVVSVSENRAPRLTPAEVHVSSSTGADVPTSAITSSQTLTSNGMIFTGAVIFTAPADGQYTVQVGAIAQGQSSALPPQFVIGRDVEDLFASADPGWLLLAIAGIGVVVGVVMILNARRGAPTSVVRPTQPFVPTTAAPGWYPDPRGLGGYLWWDGTHWRKPRPPGAAADDDPHPVGPRL